MCSGSVDSGVAVGVGGSSALTTAAVSTAATDDFGARVFRAVGPAGAGNAMAVEMSVVAASVDTFISGGTVAFPRRRAAAGLGVGT